MRFEAVALASEKAPSQTRPLDLVLSDNVVFSLWGKAGLSNSISNFLGGFIPAFKPTDVQGYVQCHRVREKAPLLVKLWDEVFSEEPVCMAFSQGLSLLAVGLASGEVEVLRIDLEKECSSFKRHHRFKNHKRRVRGLAFSSKHGKLYSAGEDKVLLCCGLGDDPKVERTAIVPFETSAFCLLPRRRLAVLGDVKGNLILFEGEEDGLLSKLCLLDSKQGAPILRVSWDDSEKYLFSLVRGALLVFDLLTPGREKYAGLHSVVELPGEATSCSVLLKEGELLLNYRRNVVRMGTQGTPRQSYPFEQEVRCLLTSSCYLFLGTD